ETQPSPAKAIAPKVSDLPKTVERTSDLKSKCPGCGDAGVRTLFRGTDRLYHTTDKVFYVVECKACRLIRLDPRPTPGELGNYYPDTYWYAPDHSLAGKLE